MSLFLEPSRMGLPVLDTGSALKKEHEVLPETGPQETIGFDQVLGEVNVEGGEQIPLKVATEDASLEENGPHELPPPPPSVPFLSPAIIKNRVLEAGEEVPEPVQMEVEIGRSASENTRKSELPSTGFSTTMPASTPLFSPVVLETPEAFSGEARLKVELEGATDEKAGTSEFTEISLPITNHSSLLVPLVSGEINNEEEMPLPLKEGIEEHSSKNNDENKLPSIRLTTETSLTAAPPSPAAVETYGGVVKQVPLKVEVEEISSAKNDVSELRTSRLLKETTPLKKTLSESDSAKVIEAESSVQSRPILTGETPNRETVRVDSLLATGLVSSGSPENSLKSPTEKSPLNQGPLNQGETRSSTASSKVQENRQGVVLTSGNRSREELLGFRVQDQNGLLVGDLASDTEIISDTITTVKNPFYSRQPEANKAYLQSVIEPEGERPNLSQVPSTLPGKESEPHPERVGLNTSHSEDTLNLNKIEFKTKEIFSGEMVETSESIARLQSHRNVATSQPFSVVIQPPSPKAVSNNGQGERPTRQKLDVVTEVHSNIVPVSSVVPRELSTDGMRQAVVVDENQNLALKIDETTFQNGPIDRPVENTPSHLKESSPDRVTISDFAQDLKAVLPADNLIKKGDGSIVVDRSSDLPPVLKDPQLHKIQVEDMEKITVPEGRSGLFPLDPEAKEKMILEFTSSSITEKIDPKVEDGSEPIQNRSETFSSLNLSAPEGEKDIQKAVFSENKFQDLKAVLPNEKAILRQVSDQIRLWKPEKETTIRLQLEPETLGSLQIEMKVEDNSVIARIITEDVAVKGLIEKNQDLLRQGLEGQGFKFERFSVDVGSMARSFDQKGSDSFLDRKAQAFYPSREDEAPAQNPVLRSNLTKSTGKRSGVLSLYA